MYKKLIFIDSKYQANKILNQTEKKALDKNYEYVIVALEENIDIRLTDKTNIICKSYLDYMHRNDKFDDIEVIKWVNKWASMAFGKQGLKEILSYNDISIYWMAVSPYIFSEYRKLCRKINIVDMVLAAERPDEVLLLNNKVDWEKVIIAVCKFRNINCTMLKKTLIFIESFCAALKLILAHFYLKVKDFIRKYAARFIYLFRHRRAFADGRKKIVFLSQPSYWRNIYDMELKKERKADDILDNVIKAFKNDRYNLVGLDIDYSRGNFKIIFDKLLLGKELYWFSIEYYYSKKITSISKNASKNIITKWKALLKDEIFQNSINYRGMPIFDLIKDNLFFKLIPFNIFCAIRYIETMKSVIKLENPRLIILAYETGPCGRAAVVAARLFNIPTLAIQHGIIHRYHDDYMLNQTSNGEKQKFLDCPIPDKTAVYGDFTKHTLVEDSSYPPEKIIVTGQPRYDSLIKMASIQGIRQRILDRFKIDFSKKILLVATGLAAKVRGQIGGQVPMIKAILSSILDSDDMYVIIKLHPFEKGTKFLYESIARKMGLLDKVRIIEEINISELIIACDLFITQNSTSTYEAMICGKHALIVNLNSEEDYVPFVEDGVAIGAYKYEAVKKAISDLLHDSGLKEQLNKNREDFIFKHCYRSDGLATNRVIDAAYNMMNK